MFHHGNISACAPYGHADVPTDGHFNMGTFWHGDFSAWGILDTMDISAHDILAREHFCTWTFLHMDILALCKAIWTFWHRHFGTCATVPKCPCAEMSPCRNFPVLKISCAENSSCWKVPMSKCQQRRMVHLLKCSRDETSVPIWLLPKCSVPKWWLGTFFLATYPFLDSLCLNLATATKYPEVKTWY